MKTIKGIATLVICAITTLAFAAISPKVEIKKSGQKAFTLYIDNSDGGRVDVFLKDVDDQTLESDRIRKREAISRVYNLENLPVGEYKLFIEDEGKTTSQTIVVHENKLMLPKNLRAEYFAPAVVHKNDNLDLTLLCLRETLVTVEIIHDSGFKNYSVGTCEKGTVQRRFDISALEPGTYTVATHLEGQNFETVYYDTFTVGGFAYNR